MDFIQVEYLYLKFLGPEYVRFQIVKNILGIYIWGCFEDEIQVESWDLSSQGALYTSAEDMYIISFRILHVKQNFFKVNFPFMVSR